MAHQWEQREKDLRRTRRCTACGAEQQYVTNYDWGRVVGYSWWPRAGRCKPERGERK